MFTPQLMFKLFLFGILWSQSYSFANLIQKVIPNSDVSATLSYTLVFVLIHMIDIYYENEIKNKQ